MKQIISWLDQKEKNYFEGLALLKKHGKSTALINRIERALKGKINSVEKRLLTIELQKIAKVKKKVTHQKVVEDVPFAKRKQNEQHGKIVIAERYEYASKNTGNSYMDLSARRTQSLFNRRQILESDLGNFGIENDKESIEKRKQILNEIDAINEEMKTERAKRLYFQEHGKVLPELVDAATLVMDKEGITKRIKQVRTNISKINKKLDNAKSGTKEKQKWDLKIQGFKAELRELESQKKALSKTSN